MGLLSGVQDSKTNKRSSDCLPGAAGLESGPARHQSGIRDSAENFTIFDSFLLNPTGTSSPAEAPSPSEVLISANAFFQENSDPAQSRVPCGSYLILMFSGWFCVPRVRDLYNGSSDSGLTVLHM